MFKTKMGSKFECPATMVEAFQEMPDQLYKGMVTYLGEEVPMEWIRTRLLTFSDIEAWPALVEYYLYIDHTADIAEVYLKRRKPNTLKDKLYTLFGNRAETVVQVIDENKVDNLLLKQGFLLTPNYIFEG